MRRVYPRKNKRTRRVAVFFVIAVFFSMLVAGAWGAYSLVKNLPGPESITDRAVAESTKIYDRTGTVLLYEIHGEEKRTVVPLRDIPQEVRIAAIAAEDAHFYEHPGLDWRGVIRAFIANIQSRTASQGGSTITQQLVKNSLLSAEKTYTRKFKEAVLAVLIERKYSKDEILELYLNQIPYGANSYGVAAATQTYFGKPIQEVTLAEAATLAVLPKAPTYYSPYGSHKDVLLEQKDRILDRIAELGLASKEKTDTAKKTALVFAPPRESIRAPHFVMYVREYLNEKYGEDFVERGGLLVITTLDWRLQEHAEKIIKEGAEKNEKLVQAYNAALVAVNSKTGEILSMVGSRDYFTKPRPEGCTAGATCKFDPHVNVTIRPRQPGSAFKPFVYATAFKKGYTAETALFDAPTEFNPGCNADGTPGPFIRDPKECYHPKNYDNTFRGQVSIRKSLAQSLNVPSVELLYLAGIPDSIQTAKDLGITTLNTPDRYGMSLVLGGAEVTLLEMTSAFGAFAQEGILHQKTAVLRVENSHGEALETTKDISSPALDTSVARTINDILSDNESRVPVFSRTSSLYFPDRQVAAKTGTTQDYRDAWTIGYTPSLVAGVWVGNSDNAAMNKAGLSVMVAAPLWRSFMDFAISSSPPESFSPPEKSAQEKPALRGMLCSIPPMRIDRISRKRATEYTPPELVEEICSGEVNPILAFVAKEDPLGPPPENPFNDPQYKNWRESVLSWFAAHPVPLPPVIDGEDDVHTAAKKPQVIINAPNEGEIGAFTNISTRIISSFPLREILFFMDDELMESKTAPLLGESFIFTLPGALSPGSHVIRVTAYDSVGNKEITERTILIIEPVK